MTHYQLQMLYDLLAATQRELVQAYEQQAKLQQENAALRGLQHVRQDGQHDTVTSMGRGDGCD